MDKTMDERIRYVRQDHIFKVDLSGRTDRSKLAEISEALRGCVKANLISDKTIKFLFDFRGVQWDSEETHMKAREISARYLQDVLRGSNYFSAILNDPVDGQSFENECLFTEEQNAVDWLRRK
ncbi:MAG: hypothetical protein A2078_07715 [Nitrospirae bacterium GWC2_57_9]|nr:MAG: hypothetical protein A2078_07715 [Nitrospirae bacterium GWC2_57_9]